jgi:hypothetical protein
MVSAILLGGNVTLAPGQLVGGAFAAIPACTAKGQTRCVIAYSSFLGTGPGSESNFGVPRQGVSKMWDPALANEQEILCVNPAALDGRRATLHPQIPRRDLPPIPMTTSPFLAFPDLFQAQCVTDKGAAWLRVTVSPGPTDRRPLLSANPSYGLHSMDVNLALGDLLGIVRAQEAAYH